MLNAFTSGDYNAMWSAPECGQEQTLKEKMQVERFLKYAPKGTSPETLKRERVP